MSQVGLKRVPIQHIEPLKLDWVTRIIRSAHCSFETNLCETTSGRLGERRELPWMPYSLKRLHHIIYATSHDGGSLLCEALNKTNIAGEPIDYFMPPWIEFYSKKWDVSLGDTSKFQPGEDYFKHIYAIACRKESRSLQQV